jgi:hypothetical protein
MWTQPSAQAYAVTTRSGSKRQRINDRLARGNEDHDENFTPEVLNQPIRDRELLISHDQSTTPSPNQPNPPSAHEFKPLGCTPKEL